MTFLAINLLCPAVLAVHNIDEYSRYDDFVRAYHSRLATKLITRQVVRNAAILLTLAVALVAGFAYILRSPVLVMLSKVAVFAMMLNAISHCALSIRRGTLLPGTLSALALVLPFSLIEIAAMRTSLGDSFFTLLNDAMYGALAIPAAILSFLLISYGSVQLAARAHKRN
jgi:hypothetical protein